VTARIAVFVNERRVELPPGATAADAVAAFDAALAAAPGLRCTDARGLPVALGAVLPGGAILRALPGARKPGEADADT